MASSADINRKICGICTLPANQPNPEGVVEDIVKLPCNHIFGNKCIDTWLKTQEYGHCPTCHVDCPKDFVDTWKLLRETEKAGESLGVEEEMDSETVFIEALEAGSLDDEKNGPDVKNEKIIEGINEADIIEGRVEAGDPVLEQRTFDETGETIGSIEGRIKASAYGSPHAKIPAMNDQIEEAIGIMSEAAVSRGRIEELGTKVLDAEQNDISNERADTVPFAEDVAKDSIESGEKTVEIVIEHNIKDLEEDTVENTAIKDEVPTSELEQIKIAASKEENDNDDDVIIEEPAGEKGEVIDRPVKGSRDLIGEGAIEDNAFDENAVDENASGESATDEETLVEEVGEAEKLKEDTIVEYAVNEEVIEEAAIEDEFGQEAAIEDERVQEEAIEGEVIAEETIGEDGVNEGIAPEEVAGENATEETTQDEVAAETTVQGVVEGNATGKVDGEDEQGPAWGTEQEGPELQAARSLHFFRTHGYGDQYRTELEASRSAAGRSTRNMVSAFNIKAHPLPEGRERAQVSKNIQVWAKYLHALKLKSLDELKTTKSRKFRVDIAGWYEKQREDFFEQLEENLESNNLAGPDVDAVKMAEDLLKTGDAGGIAELESILASLENPQA